MIAQDAIVAAVLALLRAAAPLNGAQIDADVDFDALKTGATRGVEVQLLVSSPTYLFAGPTAPREWLTRLRISCGARRDDLTVTGRPSSTLLSQVDAAISADPLLGGLLTRELRLEDIRPDNAPGATALGVMQAVYSCEHRTDWNQLTA